MRVWWYFWTCCKSLTGKRTRSQQSQAFSFEVSSLPLSHFFGLFCSYALCNRAGQGRKGGCIHKVPHTDTDPPGRGPSGWTWAGPAPTECFCPRWGWGGCCDAPLRRGASAGRLTSCPETPGAASRERSSCLREGGRDEDLDEEDLKENVKT